MKFGVGLGRKLKLASKSGNLLRKNVVKDVQFN